MSKSLEKELAVGRRVIVRHVAMCLVVAMSTHDIRPPECVPPRVVRDPLWRREDEGYRGTTQQCRCEDVYVVHFVFMFLLFLFSVEKGGYVCMCVCVWYVHATERGGGKGGRGEGGWGREATFWEAF